MIRRKVARWFALALGLTVTGIAGCGRGPEALPAPTPPTVTVVPVLARTVPVYGQYVGQTEAVQTVEVRARVEGFLERQAVPDGADVRAGDVLFVSRRPERHHGPARP
jgi:membrane fusion protein, multidrug efflux system